MTQSMLELLETWSNLLLAQSLQDEPPIATVAESDCVLRPGAAPEAIASAEARLGVTLPESYREFLLSSDGAYADWGGVVLEREVTWRRGASQPGIGLLPAADLQFVRDVDPSWVELWISGDQFEEPTERRDGQDVMDHSPLSAAILITSMGDGFRMVLVPVNETWEVWDWFKEGAVRYLSFRNWLEWRVARLLPPVATPAEFDELIERALAGDDQARLDILKVNEPGLEAAIIESLGDPDRLGLVISSAHNWPSDAVVDALAATVADLVPGDISGLSLRMLVTAALVRIGTEYAEAALIALGADAAAAQARANRSQQAPRDAAE